MKRQIIILIAIFIGICESTHAQGLRGSFGGANTNAHQVNKTLEAVKKRENAIHPTNQAKNSTVSKSKPHEVQKSTGSTEERLYRNVVRRYSWLEGVGEPISLETASHLPYYYRLSMKNAAGHWLLVEALHGNKLTTAHPFTPYILNKTYDADSTTMDWIEQLKRVGWWLFMTDLSGENVVEERAYEAKADNAALIYSSQIVRTDDTHATISYNDSWGRPADMNESEQYIYGSVVRITYNSCGLDSIIDYIDGAGYRKSNTNGVDQERMYYDAKMRLILHTSNNIAGDMATDNWGNWGNRYTYDDAHNAYTITRIDSNGNPIRMPSGRAGDDRTFIACRVTRDKWGRKAEETMLTADGKADTTQSGIHRIVYNYSNDGRLLSIKRYGLNGQEIVTNK